MKPQCSVCLRLFSTHSGMMKHKRISHSQHVQSAQSDMTYQDDTRKHVCKLEHPFTMMASGPTSCGKTTFVTDILLKKKIEPWPERIVWLYKHWQPAYDIIKADVNVEFIQGLPLSLDFDPKIRNLCVIDDLMSEIAKDSRITQLFTEGSHHCNLSVLILNQNMYHNKDPTQRRNCQYLALWNCPSDKSQIMTLAQRMFPGQNHLFMNKFHEATSKPYGYLFVDLKPYTAADKRLIANAFDDRDEIKSYAKESCIQNDSAVNQNETQQTMPSANDIKAAYDKTQPQSSFVHQGMEFCDECGTGFATVMDVMKHMDVCSADVTKQRPEENECFFDMINEARAHNAEKFDEKYKKYHKLGMSEKDAVKKAEKKCLEEDKQVFFKIYKHFLNWTNELKDTPVHKNILKDIENGSDVCRAVQKYRHEFENLLDPIAVNDSEDEKQEESIEEGAGTKRDNDTETVPSKRKKTK